MKVFARSGFTLLLSLFVAAGAAAQVQTGDLTGAVKDTSDLLLPGATVTIKSPNLQGTRTVVTDENGVYSLRALPPGEYTVTVEMSGMATKEQKVVVELGRTARLDVTLGIAKLTETVTVTGISETAAVTSTQIGANYTAKEINTLPAGRAPDQIAQLAPGLTTNTPNGNQVSISGAFAYDNVFLINGVDVNDNLFGTANNVFIEDAIQETTVLTSGISAEYGRFSGGVINVVTRSGGNDFSGSFRSTFTNDKWTALNPYEKKNNIKRTDKLNKNYEGTFGGPVLRDRLWFFAAGRYNKTSTTTTLQQTGLPFDGTNTNKRGEIKVTGTIKNGHTVSGNYINNAGSQHRLPFAFTIDPNIPEDPTFPNNLFVAAYNGALTSRLLANVQYSQKKFGFRNTGGTDKDIHASPFLTRGFSGIPGSLHFNGNYFDATDPEDRSNHGVSGTLAYFLSTARTGSHDIKGGLDRFTSWRTGGNSQTATDWRFDTDYAVAADGKPLLDANGRIVPLFTPATNGTRSRVVNWIATRGAKIDITTTSFFLQDHWMLTRQLSFNAGLRFEKVRSVATGDIVGVDTDTWVPRLAASYDFSGNGNTVLQASYAHYAGKYSEAQFARNTPVGNPTSVTYAYIGPAGQGRDFAPGFDLNNYVVIGGSFPTANIFFAPGLSSPLTKEWTVSFGRNLWNKGAAKASFTSRNYTNFVEDFFNDPSADGKVTVVYNGRNYGTFDKQIYNNSDLPKREYRALLLQSNYRLTRDLAVEGNWTVQFKNWGNFEGEAANQPAISSSVGDYPEILVESRNFPTGDVNSFQRHKVRLWATYNRDLGRFGSVSVAPLYRYESGLAYSLTATSVPLSAIQLARNPGYARLPGNGSQTLFFGERGSQMFKGYSLVDLSLGYNIPVYRSLRPWVKFDIFDLLNNDKLIQWNTTVTPDNNSPKDENGLPTGYIQGSLFGQATSAANYPRWRPGSNGGRTYILYAGIRF